MKRLLLGLSFIICHSAFSSVAAQNVPAFPGAEGHGRYVTGGRAADGSTKVYHVTNLNDDKNGTIQGSLRWALKQSGPRTIVFDVGGVIALTDALSIPANTTIAGQTAPYPGITLRYYTIHSIGNNVIIRFIRSRRGQEKDVNDGADAIWERQKTGIIIDHCSFSWSIDEVASFYDNNNFTMQWCTIGESLNNAGHGKGAHGYGGIWGGKLASFHHNLILHVGNRSPRFNGARYNWSGYTNNKLYSQYNWQNAVQSENVDFRNCVVYNCGNGCYGGPGGGQINMVNNYYKTGPAAGTSHITQASVANSTSASGYSTYWTMFSRYYISGNQLNNTANADWDKVSYDDGTKTKNGVHYTPDPNHYYGSAVTYETIDGVDCVSMKLDEPTAFGEVTTHTASAAFDQVIDYAGASLLRDDVDKRYATETRTGTATYKGSVTGKAGRIDLVSDVNGYTEANFGTGSRAADFDADNDGMADEWEQLNGGDLAPNAYTLDTRGWYTNLEVYLNSLVEDIMQKGNTNAQTAVEEYYPTCVKLPTENSSGIDAPRSTLNTQPLSTEYYDMQGRRVTNPHGLVIRIDRMPDGQTITHKTIVR
ncbi:MAG: pectate lyase [Prevotella sp.]|nr:pectate lyase [Prevotella sp.]